VTSSSTQRNLRRLVLDLKGDRTYERLSRDCGGVPTAARLQQIATTSRPRTFPDPPTVRGLSRGLGVTVTDVILAAAAGLGLPVASVSDPSSVLLAGVGDLPKPTRDALLSVAREMVRLHELAQEDPAEDEAPHDATVMDLPLPDPPTGVPRNVAARREKRRLRADEVQHLDE